MNRGFFVPILLVAIITAACKDGHYKMVSSATDSHDTIKRNIPYAEYKKLLDSNRIKMAGFYKATMDKNVAKDSITNYWVKILGTGLFDYWYGTKWDFNGITQTPKEGTIACGYFVTTLLTHMGLNISRVKLAQMPSSQMMKTLCPAQQIKSYNSLKFPQFVMAMQQLKKGVYIIGLDFHTGFIIHDGETAYFMHSYYGNNIGVIKEAVDQSTALIQSKTKWLISLTGDESLMKRWLNI